MIFQRIFDDLHWISSTKDFLFFYEIFQKFDKIIFTIICPSTEFLQIQ